MCIGVLYAGNYFVAFTSDFLIILFIDSKTRLMWNLYVPLHSRKLSVNFIKSSFDCGLLTVQWK